VIIEVELDAQTQALLASQAAARNMELRIYATSLLERVATETAPTSVPERLPAAKAWLSCLPSLHSKGWIWISSGITIPDATSPYEGISPRHQHPFGIDTAQSSTERCRNLSGSRR